MENKTINWYPGHMAKTKREIKEKISLIDIIVEVVDSRIPLSSSLKGVDDVIGSKEKIVFFSKYDLCDKEVTKKWENYFINKGYKVITGNLVKGNDFKKVINAIEELMVKINSKRKMKGLLPRKAKVLIMGSPNVGKSTLINRLTGKNRVKVGNTPGVTKALSWVKVNNNIDLLDSPGILAPKIETREEALNLASMTSIKEEILPLDDVAVHILEKLNKYYKSYLKELYSMEKIDFENLMEVYEHINKLKNLALVNGEVDYDKVNRVIINDIKSERLKGITFDRM